jgi:hypothetical protein
MFLSSERELDSELFAVLGTYGQGSLSEIYAVGKERLLVLSLPPDHESGASEQPAGIRWSHDTWSTSS